MLTKKDVAHLQTIFATKNELVEVKEEMITRFDAVMFELKAIREDMAAMLYRQREHSDQLEEYENRLSILEKN